MTSQPFCGRSCYPGVSGSRGFSLVELMIALVVGLIIILGAGKLFISGLQSFRQMDEMSRRQETLRYVSDVMLDDIRSAFNRFSTASSLSNIGCEAYVIPDLDASGEVQILKDSSNKDVTCATGAVEPLVSTGESRVLILEYFFLEDGVAMGRPGIPYCTGIDQDLHWLKYEFSESDGELSVLYECHSIGEAVEDHSITQVDSLVGEVVASGLKDVRFSYSGDFSVQVDLVFPPLEEGGSDKTFSFLVTNRAKALTLMNAKI